MLILGTGLYIMLGSFSFQYFISQFIVFNKNLLPGSFPDNNPKQATSILIICCHKYICFTSTPKRTRHKAINTYITIDCMLISNRGRNTVIVHVLMIYFALSAIKHCINNPSVTTYITNLLLQTKRCRIKHRSMKLHRFLFLRQRNKYKNTHLFATTVPQYQTGVAAHTQELIQFKLWKMK